MKNICTANFEVLYVTSEQHNSSPCRFKICRWSAIWCMNNRLCLSLMKGRNKNLSFRNLHCNSSTVFWQLSSSELLLLKEKLNKSNCNYHPGRWFGLITGNYDHSLHVYLPNIVDPAIWHNSFPWWHHHVDIFLASWDQNFV